MSPVIITLLALLGVGLLLALWLMGIYNGLVVAWICQALPFHLSATASTSQGSNALAGPTIQTPRWRLNWLAGMLAGL